MKMDFQENIRSLSRYIIFPTNITSWRFSGHDEIVQIEMDGHKIQMARRYWVSRNFRMILGLWKKIDISKLSACVYDITIFSLKFLKQIVLYRWTIKTITYIFIYVYLYIYFAVPVLTNKYIVWIIRVYLYVKILNLTTLRCYNFYMSKDLI